MMYEEKLIPVLENESLRQKEYESVELDEFIKKRFKDIEFENQNEEQKRHRKWAKSRAFYRGNQRGFWDKNRKSWVTIDLDNLSPMEQSILVINNLFRPQVKTLCKEFSRSQTRIRAIPTSDSQNSVLSARFADSLIKYYQHKLFPESMRQLEAKFLLLCGNSFRYTYYDKEKKGASVKVPNIGTKMLDPYKRNICAECGYEGSMDEENCSHCDGIMERTEVEGKEIKGIDGYKTQNSGELNLEIVDPVEIKVWAGAQHLEQSPYLRRKRLVRVEYIKDVFPFYKPRKGSKLSETATSMYQFYDTSNEKTTDNSNNLHEYDQLWLDKHTYAFHKLKKSIKLMDGTVVEAETRLSDIFPDGMYVCKVDDDILGYANESKHKCWVHIPYDNNVDGFWADGLEDAIQSQQIINEYNSMSVENVLYNASPKLVINPKLINPTTVTGRPKDMLLMNENARSDMKPEESFAQLQGMPLTQEVGFGIEMAKRDMREQTGALLAFNGQGDSEITTATGMSIARDSALALVSTSLSIKAEKDLEWNWQIIKYIQEYWYDEKYKFLLGKYNEQEAEAFRDSMVEEDVTLSIESGSWMPLTNYEKLQNLGAYLTAFGLPLGFLNPNVPPVVREYASQLYNIPFEFNEIAPDMRIAQKRISKAKDAFESLQPVLMTIKDPLQEAIVSRSMEVTLADIMGVEEDLDVHEIFAAEYTKWLKTDEGQTAHKILRNAVKQAIKDHSGFIQANQQQQMMQMAQANQTMGAEAPKGAGPVDMMQGIPQEQKGPEVQVPAESPFNPPEEGVQDFSNNQ